MSQLDLTPLARRYNSTDDDLYRDYMTKGAVTCADSSGMSAAIVGFNKGCPFDEQPFAFGDQEPDFPEQVYSTTVGGIDVYEVVFEAKKLSK